MTYKDANAQRLDDLRLSINGYRDEIAQTEKHLERLRHDLANAEEEQQQRRKADHPNPLSLDDQTDQASDIHHDRPLQPDHIPKWPLPAEEYKRYGRQLILDKIGLQGQLNLKKASVLIVGLGGLGCPAAAYLAGAGVGHIGLVDGDTVEISNLHRQILHSSSTVGVCKVDSAARYLQQLNPLPKYKTYPECINPQTAVRLLEQYDLILDCTDHPATRYLISDAAVLAGKPLVSASALGMEGQLLVLNDACPVKASQPGKYCYRCVFPKPPPADTVLSCGEGGIFGPVVGVMGVLMATAALKILIRGTTSPFTSDRGLGVPPDQPSLLLYSALSEPMFRNVRIKGRRDNCPSCSSIATITRQSLMTGSLDYAAFCGLKPPTEILDYNERIKPSEYARLINRSPYWLPADILVIDVRPKIEYELGHIEGSINWPFQDLSKKSCDAANSSKRRSSSPDPLRKRGVKWDEVNLPANMKCAFTICRRGNDSQMAAKLLKEQRTDFDFIVDIKGGLEAWRREVDPTFPNY
ncbi:MAG: hypothetical protein L6R40_004713 [Gallowayella cf. fulva]|nr:MAG: hypothetical protein L6R40_004713 [Xanthomendoza cf. fulva]